jgi:hypothetical protein
MIRTPYATGYNAYRAINWSAPRDLSLFVICLLFVCCLINILVVCDHFVAERLRLLGKWNKKDFLFAYDVAV